MYILPKKHYYTSVLWTVYTLFLNTLEVLIFLRIYVIFYIVKNTIICIFCYNTSIHCAPLAQLVEQQPFKLMVAGSNPARRTTQLFSILFSPLRSKSLTGFFVYLNKKIPLSFLDSAVFYLFNFYSIFRPINMKSCPQNRMVSQVLILVFIPVRWFLI